MSGTLRTSRLVCKSAEARDTVSYAQNVKVRSCADERTQVIEALQHTAIEAATRFDEVEQYLVAIPLEDTSKSDVYVIEE